MIMERHWEESASKHVLVIHFFVKWEVAHEFEKPDE
jgi:hypothetical protein